VRARKIDSNQTAIVQTLRDLGCKVHILNDVVDVLIGYGGITFLGEIRPADKPAKPREGRQKKFHDSWTGGIYWLQTMEHAIQCHRTMTQWHYWITKGALDEARGKA
jgi:hypothetical protein